MYGETVGQGCWSPVRPPPLSSSPTLEHPRLAEPARNPGAAFPECVQGAAAKGSSEESGQGCALRQGPAAFPAQPGGGRAGGGHALGGSHPGACHRVLRRWPLSPLGCQRLLLGAVPLPPLLPGPWSRRTHFPGAGRWAEGAAGGRGEQTLGRQRGPSPSLPLCSGRGCYH